MRIIIQAWNAKNNIEVGKIKTDLTTQYDLKLKDNIKLSNIMNV